MISDKIFTVYFRSSFLPIFQKPNTNQVAVLASNEYEGFSKNGGIGTYYTALSKKLREAGWYVILLLCQSEQKFQGKSDVPALDCIFSTAEVEDVLTLQPIHLSILSEAKSDYYYTYQSICYLFFMQALSAAFPDAQVYVEFADVNAFGYHTIQAKQAGLLPSNCIAAVTIHGCFEWVFEANDSLTKEPWFLLTAHREQQSFEQSDLTFFPSYFLKNKVESYGWYNPQAKHIPYFIPLLVVQ